LIVRLLPVEEVLSLRQGLGRIAVEFAVSKYVSAGGGRLLVLLHHRANLVMSRNVVTTS